MIQNFQSVVVALSGGIDSSLSAAILKRAGWSVLGLHFRLPASRSLVEERLNAVHAVCRHLDISLKCVDLTDDFQHKVIKPFIENYLKGLTPNPCIVCNEVIKFETLLRYAEAHNISCLATGHYAVVKRTGKGAPVGLFRGLDRGKEQSYFLHRLKQKHLTKTIFPLAHMTKGQTRKKTLEMNLPVHGRPESQEICFLSGRDYRFFVEKGEGDNIRRKGNIIDDQEKILGHHGGAYRFTIGQRQGLGIASSRPYYVKEIRPEENEVVVGRREEIFLREVSADHFNWINGPPHEDIIKSKAQVRYRHRAASGILRIFSEERVAFTFDEPQWAPAPGQALVCYEGDRVLGGGWIVGRGK
jgi:tRNA-specific 2-thiouridylase